MNKILFLLTVIVLLGGVGCNYKTTNQIVSTPPQIYNQESPAVASSVSVPTTDSATAAKITAASTIDKSNPTTWPRFIFKELGFSISMPLKEVEVNFTECRGGKPYGSDGKLKDEGFCDNENHYYSFFVVPTDTSGDIINIGSVTKLFSAGREWTPNLMYNFHKVGDNYKYGDPGTDSLIIRPLKILFRQGREIVILDEIKDFFGKNENNPFPTSEYAVYGIAVKITGNKIFKAAAIEGVFKNTEDSLQVVTDIAESIKFTD